MSDERIRTMPSHPAEGATPAPVLPAGLRRVPTGVDELTTEHLILNMGPQHPSTHGVLHVLLELDGEEVKAAEASLGYLHRGIEKLAEHRRYHQVGTLLDRARLRLRHPHRDRVRAGRRAARRDRGAARRRSGSAR